jgi:hypothetical protein
LSIAKPRSASLVETIGAGYRVLNRRPWVLSIPALFSAYLWLGTPVGLGAVGARLEAGLREAGAMLGDEREQMVQSILSSDLRLAMAWLNFMPVLAPPAGQGRAMIGLDGPGQLLAAAALINLGALLLSSAFLTALSEAVTSERRPPLALLRHSLGVAGTIVRYLLALAGVGLVLALPFLALSAIVIAALPGAAVAILLAWYVALFWAYVYTGFAPEAILISRAGPLRAIYHSFHVVRQNMSATLGLLLISFVVASGLGLIWRQVAATPLGLATAIIGSAYVGSGLSAARLVFYRERQAR